MSATRVLLIVALPFALAVSCASCETQQAEQRGIEPSGPTLVALDSVRLLEQGTEFIGWPRPATVDPFDGTIYISDTFQKRVLRFDRSGELLHTYGRPGPGPGEFAFNELVFVLDDSTVAVVDNQTRQLKLFDRTSGAYRDGLAFGPRRGGLTVPVREHDDLWFAAPDHTHRRAIAHWNLHTGTTKWIGDMPDEYHVSLDERGLSYANQLLEAVLTRVGSHFVMGWSVRNDLFVYDSNGTVVDTIDIPVARRRGVPENLRYRLDVERVPLRERFTASSRLVQLTSFPDGGLAVIHNDEEILSDEGPVPVTAARPWLSVITPDRHFACVDGRVPASLDAMAAASFSGDTLLVIDRRIVSDDELETWLVTYRIDTSSCDWLPLSRR